MHFFGLLSIREVVDGRPVLAIPNQTVRRLLYGFLRDGYDDVGTFAVDLFAFDRLMSAMANAGAWRPVFEFLRDAVAAQTGIRDYIAGEKVLQGFLAAYLSVSPYFVFRSEAELGKRYAPWKRSRQRVEPLHDRRLHFCSSAAAAELALGHS